MRCRLRAGRARAAGRSRARGWNRPAASPRRPTGRAPRRPERRGAGGLEPTPSKPPFSDRDLSTKFGRGLGYASRMHLTRKLAVAVVVVAAAVVAYVMYGGGKKGGGGEANARPPAPGGRPREGAAPRAA